MERRSVRAVRLEDDELDDAAGEAGAWMGAYGLLMACMAVFFMILHASDAARVAAEGARRRAFELHFAENAQEIEQLFSRYGDRAISRVEIAERRARLVFPAQALFDSGGASLKPGASPVLLELAKILAGMPNAVQIEGHTDDRPPLPGAKFGSNADLSAARAFAVLRFLESGGVERERLSAVGYGGSRPQQNNDTPEGRAANRRIEIVILRRPS